MLHFTQNIKLKSLFGPDSKIYIWNWSQIVVLLVLQNVVWWFQDPHSDFISHTSKVSFNNTGNCWIYGHSPRISSCSHYFILIHRWMFSENILDIIELVLFTHSSVWSNDTSSDVFRCIDCCLSVVLKFTTFGSINPCSYTLKVLGFLEVKKTMWYRDNQWYESLLM